MTPRLATILLAVAVMVGCTVPSQSSAAPPAISILQGTVEKAEKGKLKVSVSDKGRKSYELKITGTSNLHLLAPQMRNGKTIITQRELDAADLVPGQSIAVIYTLADDEYVLLSAVAKAAEKE